MLYINHLNFICLQPKHIVTTVAENGTILDAGNAAMHRAYTPAIKDVITLLDITENIVESVFLHEAKIEELKKRVPQRGK